MSTDRRPEDHLPLTPATFNVLLALAGGEHHGYAIMREISARTEGSMRLGPTTLYRTIKQMVERGWIEETEQRPDPELDDQRRRYYRLTSIGRAVATAEVERMHGLVNTARAAGLVQVYGRARSET